MKTLDLVTWKRNANQSNIYVSALGGDELFLKRHYAAVFKECAEALKTSRMSSFVRDVWEPACDRACTAVRSSIVDEVVRKSSMPVSEESLSRVVNKFRGNLGEIMVEMLAENGILDFIKPGTYTPVDPEKEEFFDATGKRNGLLVGVQVKNYSRFDKVKLDTFLRAAAQSDLWLRRDQKCSAEDLVEFTSSPCQYIISTAEAELGLEDMFRGSVVFLGPKWLDSKRIQGAAKTKESPRWKMLEETAREIEAL